jgi:hypothetical protein
MEQQIPPQTDLAASLHSLEAMVRELSQYAPQASSSALVPDEVAYRDPASTYHQITIGAVLCAHGFTAHDARRFDGLLSKRLADVLADAKLSIVLKEALTDSLTVGEALTKILHAGGGQLEAAGRMAEWRRSFETYMAKSEAFLAGLNDEVRATMLRRPPSKKQLWLVRETCAALQLEFPELPNRLAAFEWLWANGANVKFKEIVR